MPGGAQDGRHEQDGAEVHHRRSAECANLRRVARRLLLGADQGDDDELEAGQCRGRRSDDDVEALPRGDRRYTLHRDLACLRAACARSFVVCPSVCGGCYTRLALGKHVGERGLAPEHCSRERAHRDQLQILPACPFDGCFHQRPRDAAAAQRFGHLGMVERDPLSVRGRGERQLRDAAFRAGDEERAVTARALDVHFQIHGVTPKAGRRDHSTIAERVISPIRPDWKSRNACSSSSSLFITKGP